MKSKVLRCLLAVVLCLSSLSGIALGGGMNLAEPVFAEEAEADEPVITSFADVQNPARYYYTPVYWASGKNIAKGISKEGPQFGPDFDCTRGQIVTFLWRAAGCPEPVTADNPFEDIDADQYFYKAVLWAVEKGITKGTADSVFEPNTSCKRGQSVTFIWRYFGSPGNGEDAFSDVKSDRFYYKAVYWAVQNGVTSGMTAKQFMPDSPCSRGQIVSFLYHAMLDSSASREDVNAFGHFTISDVDGQKATFRINANTLKADSAIEEVRAAVSSGAGSDLRWFNLSPVEYGSFYKKIEAFDLSGFAEYTVKWYIVTEDSRLIHMDTQTVDVKKVNYATAADIGNKQFLITIEGVDPAVNSISSCVWSEKNGNDDVRWTSMTRKDSTTWQATVNCIDYKDSGVFLTDLYSDSGKLLASLRYNVPAAYLVLTPRERIARETEKVYASVGKDLRACYNYSVKIPYYRPTPEPPSGYTPSEWYALYGFDNHKGLCYVRAATFYWLAKNMGYEVYFVQGQVKTVNGVSVHGWCEIVIDGQLYVCDPSFEAGKAGRDGYMFKYGTKGTWMYINYKRVD